MYKPKTGGECREVVVVRGADFVLIELIPFVLDYLHVKPLSVSGSCQTILLPHCVGAGINVSVLDFKLSLT